jgi:CubicO group peptidase (beta-lactamase class C family)
MLRRIALTVGLILLWTLLVVAVVLADAYWFPQPPVVRGDFASIEDHLVGRLGSAGLVLIQGGEIAAEHGFGVANPETQAPSKPDQTLYLVASVSKAVTAWGVMKLVEEGRIALDEPVMRHLERWRFPGSETYRDKVTARHLLAHTAGLDDGLGYGGFSPGERVQTLEESLTLTVDSTVGEPRPVRVAWEPGRAMAYSGAGYAILQLLIEEVTERPFADYMKEAVLQPLGMTRSSFDLDAIVAEGRIEDAAVSMGPDMRPHPHRRHTAQAAVSLYTTPRELARFVLAYGRENPVLRQETVKQMFVPQPGTGGIWGLGNELFVENGAGGHVVGHVGGSPPAWGASIRFNPATGNGMVLTGCGGRGATNMLGHDWIYWETGTVTPEAKLEVVYRRARPAALTILIGAAVLVFIGVWRTRRREAS